MQSCMQSEQQHGGLTPRALPNHEAANRQNITRNIDDQMHAMRWHELDVPERSSK